MFATTYKSASEVNQAMGRVFGYMGLATLVSMFVSFIVGSDPHLVQFFFSGIMHWIVVLSPILAVFLIGMALASNPPREVCVLLLVGFAALMGLSLSIVFAVYTMMSIVNAFMGASILFGVMAFYGYFTKRSLEGLGSWLLVGLIAIIIASVINIFIGSSVMQMVISAIAIVIFLGFTAYDTQTIREMVSEDDSPAIEVMGALSLYLDFINLFVNLLQLFGVTSSDD